MTSRRALLLLAFGALLAGAFATLSGAATKTATTTVAEQESGATEVRCKKRHRVVAAYVHGEAASAGPHVTVNTLARPTKRRVEAKAFNFGTAGDLTAIAKCKKRPKSKLRSATSVVPAATFSSNGEATTTARCPRGKRLVFGGFRAERAADAPDYVFIHVIAAMREGARRWTVRALNSYVDGSGTVEALAYCGKTKRTKARTGTASLGQFETGSAVAACQRGEKVRYGGFEQVPGSPGRPDLHAIEAVGGGALRVTATESFYLSPGDTMGLKAIAYCR